MWILLVWDGAGEAPVTAQIVEALIWKTQTLRVSRQIKPSYWLIISLDLVVPKSQSRAQLLGLDCNERLGSAPAEMGVPQLHCLPSVAAAFWGQGFLIHLSCVPFCSTLTLPTWSESWVLFVRWFKLLVAGAFTTWALERKQTWWMALPQGQLPKDSNTKWGIKEQSLTTLKTKAVFAAPLSFASRRKLRKCYTENRSWNKLPHLKAQILENHE